MSEASRRWEKRNPEKVAAYRKCAYERNKDTILPKVCAASAARYARNPAAKLAINAAWRKTNGARMKELNRRWREANKGRMLSNTRAYQLAKQKRLPVWADVKAIAAIYECAARLTVELGTPHHVDHDIPLRGVRVSGLHVPSNLIVIPALENIRKGNRYAI